MDFGLVRCQGRERRVQELPPLCNLVAEHE